MLRADTLTAQENVAGTARKLQLHAVASTRRSARRGDERGARGIVDRTNAVSVEASHETMSQLTSAAQQRRAVSAVGNNRTLVSSAASRTRQSRITIDQSVGVPQSSCTQTTAPATNRPDTTWTDAAALPSTSP